MNILTIILAAALLLTISLLIRSLFRQAGLQDTLKETSDTAEGQLKLWEEFGQHLDEGVALINSHDEIVYANQAFAALTGWPNRSSFHQQLSHIVTLQNEAAETVELPSHNANAVLHVIAKDGRRTAVHPSRRRLYKPEGFSVIILGDATAELAEKELRHRLVNLSSFELRAPVTAMKGYASMLLDGDAGKLSKPVREYLQPILDSTENVLTIIDDMAHVAELSNTKPVAKKRTVAVRDFLTSVTPQLQNMAAKADRKLEASVEGPSAELSIDADQVTRLLAMLTNTAARTAPNKSTVTLSFQESAGTVDIHLGNNGSPLPRQSQANVFDYAGGHGLDMGIGFYVAKQIIEDHHAYVTVNTKPDGNDFVLSLPKVQTKPAPDTKPVHSTEPAGEATVDQVAEAQIAAAEAKGRPTPVDPLSKSD